MKIIEPYWTSVIYWRRENPRSFACGFCLGVKLLLLLLQFMTLLHEAFCSSLKHRRLWKTQRIEYRIEHDRTKMNLSRPMFQCFTKYYKVKFGKWFQRRCKIEKACQLQIKTQIGTASQASLNALWCDAALPVSRLKINIGTWWHLQCVTIFQLRIIQIPSGNLT